MLHGHPGQDALECRTARVVQTVVQCRTDGAVKVSNFEGISRSMPHGSALSALEDCLPYAASDLLAVLFPQVGALANAGEGICHPRCWAPGQIQKSSIVLFMTRIIQRYPAPCGGKFHCHISAVIWYSQVSHVCCRWLNLGALCSRDRQRYAVRLRVQPVAGLTSNLITP